MTGARPLPPRPIIRRLSLLLALAGILALLWLRGPAPYLSGFGSVGTTDFVAYWSAARLVLDGGDPYDPAALLAVEQAAGWPKAEPWMIWNPPWTLVLVLPLAPLPFGLAAVIWFLLQLGLILSCSVLLWCYFAPGDDRYWIPLALATAFVPGLLALRIGQVSGWLLVGVVGFLYAERSRRDVLAGGALSVLMIKPHVTYLFWLAALWWAWRGRRWWVLIGWLGALTGTSGLVLLFAPDVFVDYLTTVAKPPLQWVTPTLGGWLRLLFGVERCWLQFLPSLLAGLLMLTSLYRRRRLWRWEVAAAPLLLASVFTAVYGGICDQVVLLVVVMALVGRLRSASSAHRVAVLGAWITSQLLLVVQNRYQVYEVFHVWHVPVLAGLHWWSGKKTRYTDMTSQGG